MNADLYSLLDATPGTGRVLLLDYDGTLVPFTSAPELAVPDPELLSLLASLAARSDTRVHVVSGRCRHSLGAWLGHLPIGLHAEHGYWMRHHASDPWTARFTSDHCGWMEQASTVMHRYAAAIPGSFVERKTVSLAWHYRNADVGRAAAARAALSHELQPLCASHRLGLLDGVLVLELRQGRVNKGDVVRSLVKAHGDDVHVVAIGDDVTDEDMFAALPPRGFAIAASARAVSPRHRLDGPPSVRAFLHGLCGASST